MQLQHRSSMRQKACLWLTAIAAAAMLILPAPANSATYAEEAEARRDAALTHYSGNTSNINTQLARLWAGLAPNEGAFHDGLNMMDSRIDTADFRLATILRMLYQFGDSPLLSSALLDRARSSVLGFKYWPDEPGIDSLCTWTENHQILYAGGAYLAGRLCPNETFTNSGQTGTELMAFHRPRILRWLDFRFRTGFSEWLSNVYYDEDIAALVNLIDFSGDPEITLRATMVLDLMFTDMALNNYQGMFGSTHGRTYERQKKWPSTENTTDPSWIMFGLGNLRSSSMSGVYLALTPNYRMPQVIYEIANDQLRPAMINKQRMGIKVEDGALWGLAYDNFEDGMVWLSMEAYAHPMTINLFVDMLDAWNWWDNDFFAPFAAQRDLIEYYRGIGQLSELVETYHHDVGRNTRDEVNIYTYRTPDYMLSASQDYRKTFGGDQHHIWQATVGPDVTCFTTHPATYGSGSVTPNYWAGSGYLPRVAQAENVVIAIYDATERPGLYFTETLDFTHAWLPKDQFDEVVESDGWVFARSGDAYLAFRTQHDYFWQTEPGEDQDRELIVPGRKNVYICELGRQAVDTSFANFMQQILDASLTLGDLSVEYHSPSQGVLQFAWDGPLYQDGQIVPLADYPRYSNPYFETAFPSDIVMFQHAGCRLRLDWQQPSRQMADNLTVASDLDGDGDVDGHDFITFSFCFNGSLRPPKPTCETPWADLDLDGHVDGTDFMSFSSCFNGSLRPPKCP